MNYLTVLLASVTLTAATPLKTESDAVPPARYQTNNIAQVVFVDRADIQRICRSSNPNVVACASGNTIIMQNPCPSAYYSYYAQIMCHELGHVNGWPGYHPF